MSIYSKCVRLGQRGWHHQVQTLAYTKPHRWQSFVQTLGLKTPLEFNEGDVGMAGGIQAPEILNSVSGQIFVIAQPNCFFFFFHQVMEPQNLAVVATDRILRFGGSCSQDLEWPADNSKTAGDEEEEKSS